MPRTISTSRFIVHDRHTCSGRFVGGPPDPLPKPTFRPLVDTTVLPCPRRARRLVHETSIVPARLRCAKNAPNEGPGSLGRLTVRRCVGGWKQRVYTALELSTRKLFVKRHEGVSKTRVAELLVTVAALEITEILRPLRCHSELTCWASVRSNLGLGISTP